MRLVLSRLRDFGSTTTSLCHAFPSRSNPLDRTAPTPIACIRATISHIVSPCDGLANEQRILQTRRLDPSDALKQSIPQQTAIGNHQSIVGEASVIPQRGLVDSEQLDLAYESDFNSPTIEGRPRRVDQEGHSSDWGIWLELVRYRRRYDGPRGARTVFAEMMSRELPLPTVGPVAQELWLRLVQSGQGDIAQMGKLVSYALWLHNDTGRSWSEFYKHAVGYALLNAPSSAYRWHQRLKPLHVLKQPDYSDLFQLCLLRGKKSLDAFRSIYMDHPLPGLYDIVIPLLCKKRMYAAAADWHNFLLGFNDSPTSFKACSPILYHYEALNDEKQLEYLLINLANAQVWIEEDARPFMERNTTITREVMNRVLGEAHGIAPKTLSDDFCARLFATRLFSTDLVISGLRAVGVESLGPSSLRELVAREQCEPENISGQFDKLNNLGIPVEISRYSIVIRKAAFSGKKELVKSIIDCDIHPDAFEDLDLQERLLARYYADGDDIQVERSILIALCTVDFGSFETHRTNLLLRCYITLRLREKILSTVEHMQHNNMLLMPRTSRHLRHAYLPPRKPSKAPIGSKQEIEDLGLVINVMKFSLQSGGHLPLFAWVDCMRRLGMLNQLDQLQNLSLWLVDWYRDRSLPIPNQRGPVPKYRDLVGAAGPTISGPLTSSRMLVPRRVEHDRQREDSAALQVSDEPGKSHSRPSRRRTRMPVTTQPQLLMLFPRSFQESVIAWGFQAEIKRRPNLHQSRTKRLMQANSRWQWGLRLLKELNDRGLRVEKSFVAKCCQDRLTQLFDTSISNRIVNRRARELNNLRAAFMSKYTYSTYMKEMDEIWGRDLFDHGESRAVVQDGIEDKDHVNVIS